MSDDEVIAKTTRGVVTVRHIYIEARDIDEHKLRMFMRDAWAQEQIKAAREAYALSHGLLNSETNRSL
jgi:hypothetical protein